MQFWLRLNVLIHHLRIYHKAPQTGPRENQSPLKSYDTLARWPLGSVFANAKLDCSLIPARPLDAGQNNLRIKTPLGSIRRIITLTV